MRLTKKFKTGDIIKEHYHSEENRIFKLIEHSGPDEALGNGYITAINIVTGEPHFFHINYLDQSCMLAISLKKILKDL